MRFVLQETSTETIKVTAMVFAILVGATAFSMVFTYSGGDTMVEEFIHNLPAKEMSCLCKCRWFGWTSGQRL
jgi:TRAP-type mannitol/chloroaromatic compound transport system permease large subunit